MAEATETVYLRLGTELLERCDAWADEMNKRMRAIGAGGFKPTNRTAAIRILIERGLEAMHADEGLAIVEADADGDAGNPGPRKLAGKLARPRKGGRRG